MRARSLAIPGCIGLLALLLGACFAPSYPTGIACSEVGTCPPGQFCVEGICRLESGPGPGDDDASMPQPPDASIPQPPDASILQPPDAPLPPPDATPVACTGAADCNDDVACTTDTCVDQRCVNAVDDSVCNDGVACTADRCDAVLGCVAAPNDSACSDGVACTTDRCDAVQGCVAAPNDSACNDGIACTANRCDAAQGCVATPNDSACNDGIACTADRCDTVQGCVAAPNDSACNDGVACTTDRCDATQGCVAAPNDSACSDGVACTTDRCDATQGCRSTPNDAVCNDGDACTNDICSPETSCVNDPIRFCTTPCQTVLIYNDNALAGYNLPMRAAEALGMPATVASDGSSFAAAFDAGGFDLLIIDASDAGVPAVVTSRLISWLDSGGRLVFAHFNLDANATLRTALRVNTVRDLSPAPPVHADPNSPINFFTLVAQFPSPLSFGDSFGDNGDALTLAAQGFVAARFGSATSTEGAILVTRNDRAVVMGFLPADAFFSSTDADGDGVNDAEELYRNEIRFLCSAPLQ